MRAVLITVLGYLLMDALLLYAVLNGVLVYAHRDQGDCWWFVLYTIAALFALLATSNRLWEIEAHTERQATQ